MNHIYSNGIAFFVAGILLLTCTCCTKNSSDAKSSIIKKDTVVSVVTPPPPPPPPANNSDKVITMGNGSGELVLDGINLEVNGKKVDIQNIDTIKINEGSYNGITIKNFTDKTDKRLIITNRGLVKLQGDFVSMDIENLNNVTISGGGTAGIIRGFQFLNNKFRAIKLRGLLTNFTVEKMLFKNVSDYVIYYEENDKRVYTGAVGSYAENLSFLDLDAENVGQFIGIPGEIGSSLTGFVKNIEIGRVTCLNAPEVGAVVLLGNCENYNVHDNFVNNVNTAINNHNGIFMLRGNGRYYNNVVKNHQGNALRAWLYSIAYDNQSSVEIYNNVVYNSRKYSAFELQVPPYIKSSYLFKSATAKVYNNTIGKMNTERHSFPGRLLDLYNTYSTLELYNNLVFDDNDDIILNNMSDSKIVINSDNVYKSNTYDAVVDLNRFVSKVPGVGAGN